MSYYAEIYGWDAENDRLAKAESYRAMIRNERQAAAEDEANRRADEAYQTKARPNGAGTQEQT